MKLAKISLMTTSLLALAACGGGGGGGGISGSASGALNYAPIYRTEATGSIPIDIQALDKSLRNLGESTGHGATGIMSTGQQFTRNVDITGFTVKLSGDRETLTLSRPGEANIVLAADTTPDQFGGSWGNFSDGYHVSLNHAASGHFGKMVFKYTKIGSSSVTNIYGEGIYGLETPLAQLPSGDANYSGDFVGLAQLQALASGSQAMVDGTFDMTVNFDSGSVTGSTLGDISVLNPSFNVTDADATGTISGSTSGNGFTGNWTLNGATYAMNAGFAGKTYGWNAEDVGGALVGTITGGGENLNLSGTFESN